MKKAIVCIILTAMMFSMASYAQPVYLPYEFVSGNSAAAKEMPEYIRDQCQFTGADYLKSVQDGYMEGVGPRYQFLRSQDGVNWEVVREFVNIYYGEVPSQAELHALRRLEGGLSPLSGLGSTQIINTGNGYIRRDREADWGCDKGVPMCTLDVYDYNLNPVKSYEFDRPPVQMSYVDGVCYVVLYDPYVLMKSTDFENWEVVGENLGVPVTLGNKTIMRTYVRHRSLLYGATNFYAEQNPMLFVDGQPAQSIDVEGADFNGLRVVGDYFVATNTAMLPDENGELAYVPTAFFYSKDGVYWAKQDLSDEREFQPSDVFDIKAFDGKLYVQKYANKDLYVFNLEDLDRTVPQSNIYIQLDDEILGFDTPPVMESDRILVPVRFITEKTGADVEWDGEEQMVVVQQDDTTVEMTINNPKATVNGRMVAMDVAPQIVNNRTMIPLRFLSENLGYEVTWDNDTQTAIIRTEEPGNIFSAPITALSQLWDGVVRFFSFS